MGKDTILDCLICIDALLPARIAECAGLEASLLPDQHARLPALLLRAMDYQQGLCYRQNGRQSRIRGTSGHCRTTRIKEAILFLARSLPISRLSLL
jgi:hypothetical protein